MGNLDDILSPHYRTKHGCLLQVILYCDLGWGVGGAELSKGNEVQPYLFLTPPPLQCGPHDAI